MKKIALLLCTFVAALPLSAQVALSFSGGSGSPLTVNVQNDATFTLTADGVKFDFFFFDISGFGNLAETSVSGSLGFTTNGGALDTFETANNSAPAGHSGILLWSSSSTWHTGDTVVLHAGSFTTAANYAAAAPSAGSYNVYLADNMLNYISGAGSASAVPEPSTYAAIFGALGLGAVAVVRQRRRAAAGQN